VRTRVALTYQHAPAESERVIANLLDRMESAHREPDEDQDEDDAGAADVPASSTRTAREDHR